jgi:hypothetical protein
MKKTSVALSILFLTIGVGQAMAAGQFSIFGGYLNPGDRNLSNVGSSVQTGLQFRGTALYGLRGEADFLKVLGIEQNLAFSPRLFNATLFPNGVQGSDARGILYSSNLVVNVPIGHFVPFATAGVGLLKAWNFDVNPLSDTKFAVNYGGGIKLNRLAGPVGLRFDLRGWSVRDVFGENLNMFEASGGITFTWGK